MSDAAPVVVKLGGSVLTRKRESARLRPKILARLSSELAAAGDRPIVLLHGAGSFGHPGAIRWSLAEPPGGTGDTAHRARGAAIVSSEVRRLHGFVVQALLDAGLSPFSVPPQVIAENRRGRLETLEIDPFRRVLGTGGLPVSFGDVVRDSDWGHSILSADTIAVELVRRLPAKRLIFVSDVDGVMEATSPGHRRRAVPRVTPELVASLQPSPGVPDVTGGIRAKAQAVLDAAGAGADAGIISGLRHGALSRALRGESVYGSWCTPEVT